MKVLPAAITSLERKVGKKGQALALGLCKVVKQYNFMSTLYMMCDILSVVSRLSRTFQSSTIDLATVHVDNLVDQTGMFARQLDFDISSSLTPFDIHDFPEMKQKF